ncbi:nuclease-related domain-containing DEAD/DEAH box helicase [Alteromonas sp. P256]|uniref:nuclease-related domain-containing DEAD/DEAH box helicase n=1 Tax=Alteromonas sp. P256 TaxID=3117399 RepID=UPI002FE2CDE9
MATIYPTLENIQRLKVPPTDGELHLVKYLEENLDETYEVFFNPYLDGDRPDIIIMKKGIGVFVIEVKDWDLSLYTIDDKNSWSVMAGQGRQRVKSPQSQAFNYKKNLYDLHLPVVGIRRLTNPNFYNLVHCFVYFHKADQEQLASLYKPVHSSNAMDRQQVQNDYRSGTIRFEKYERVNESLLNKKRQIQRDERMSFGYDSIKKLVKKIRNQDNHVLFDEDVYRDFKRRLSPSEHEIKQGIDIKLDDKQKRLTLSDNGKQKIKGVAGCGKTTILASRAINARGRHGSEVLILTFNITLKNYIRDKLSDLQGGRDFTSFEISNYHQFFNSQLNNTSQDIVELVARYGLERLYDVDLFSEKDTVKYDTVLVDEIQDYKPEWVKIIRDNFLKQDGEMVLLGDDSQDIYARNSGRSAVIAQGFGRWNKLTRSYRTSYDSPLNRLFKEFQLNFLIDKYSDTDVIETPAEQLGMGFSLLKHEKLPTADFVELAFETIQELIKAYDLHPNDTIIISSKIFPLRKLNDLLTAREKTHCMFETYQELAAILGVEQGLLEQMTEHEVNKEISASSSEVERVRRIKKNHFYANSGNIKLSTTHSYKGLEAKTVFYIMLEEDEPELIYTSITRSTENLVILDSGGRSVASSFFSKAMK